MRMYQCHDGRVAEVYGRDISTSTSAMGISRFHFHAVSSGKKETLNVHGYTSRKSTDMPGVGEGKEGQAVTVESFTTHI